MCLLDGGGEDTLFVFLTGGECTGTNKAFRWTVVFETRPVRVPTVFTAGRGGGGGYVFFLGRVYSTCFLGGNTLIARLGERIVHTLSF